MELPAIVVPVTSFHDDLITENDCAASHVVAADGQVYDSDRLMYLRNGIMWNQLATSEGIPPKGNFNWSAMGISSGLMASGRATASSMWTSRRRNGRRAGSRTVILQSVERWATLRSNATTSPSITVLSGSFASASTTAGYRTLKSLSFRDRRLTVPFRLNAMARCRRA